MECWVLREWAVGLSVLLAEVANLPGCCEMDLIKSLYWGNPINYPKFKFLDNNPVCASRDPEDSNRRPRTSNAARLEETYWFLVGNTGT